MVSIYRACRESRKQMRAKRKGKMEMLGGREMKDSVFILVQVSLFIKVFILRRRKAFLRNRKKKRMLFRFSALFYCFVNHKNQRRHPNRNSILYIESHPG